jgi:hypothetical protein
MEVAYFVNYVCLKKAFDFIFNSSKFDSRNVLKKPRGVGPLRKKKIYGFSNSEEDKTVLD